MLGKESKDETNKKRKSPVDIEGVVIKRKTANGLWRSKEATCENHNKESL